MKILSAFSLHLPSPLSCSRVRRVLLLVCILYLMHPADSRSAENISLRQYLTLSIPVTNPVDVTRLPRSKMFQIKDQQFILQFFFNERDIFGFVLKRDKKLSLYLRWCFFRSCEESPFDYTVRIAAPNRPPFVKGFFVVNFPPGIQYDFQGLLFSSPR